MKQFIYCVVFCAATAHSVVAQVSNMVRLVPNQSLVAVHARFGAKELFRIATNTPAFEDYGKHFMLAQVNDMRDKWHLEIPKKLAVEDLLFHIKPTAFGIAGVVETRDIRFRWIFERNAINHFWDLKYAPSSFRYHDDESAMLAKLPSIITAKEAEALARNALHKLGLTEELIGIKNTPERHQYKFEESNGTIYELPVFNITWRYNGPTRYAAENLEMSPVEMVISGIITNVVEYSNIEVASPKSVIHRPPMPTNYFQMLGLPTNYLDTLPERKRAVWGMPPLTNRWSEQQSTFNGESKSSTLVNMLFGSATNIAIIQNATTVLAYRILPMADPKKPAKKSIIGYPVVSGPVKVSK